MTLLSKENIVTSFLWGAYDNLTLWIHPSNKPLNHKWIIIYSFNNAEQHEIYVIKNDYAFSFTISMGYLIAIYTSSTCNNHLIYANTN